MRRRSAHRCAVVAGAVLTACASAPSAPSVIVLPGSSVSLEEFRGDDAICRDWARQEGRATPGEAAEQDTAAGAAVGTAVGAASGAAIGAAAEDPAAGAAIGAGSGLLVGSAAGSARGDRSAAAAQRRYDAAYIQCMYAKGNLVPVRGGSSLERSAPPPQAQRRVPPPPAGAPPPPPPGVG